MSVRFAVKDFGPELHEMVATHLHLAPKEKYVPGKSKFAPKKLSEPIRFYDVIGDYIHLPMAYAGLLTKTPPNRHLQHSPHAMCFNPEKSLLPRQVDVIPEALQYLDKIGGVHLDLYPGFGKTVVSCYLACQLGHLTMVYLHMEVFIKQWKKVFTDFAVGAKIWVVGEKFPELKPGEYISVIICMEGRYHKIPDPIMRAVGTVIVDEAHNFCVPSRVGALLAPQPKYIISCTATLERDDGMESIIETLVGKTAISRESKRKFEYIELRTGLKIPVENTKNGTCNYPKFTNDVCDHVFRNTLIVKLVLDNPEKKILVMTGRVNHAKYLCSVLQKLGESCDYIAGKKKTYKDSRVLIGSSSMIGEGFDEANFCEDWNGVRMNMLILCNSIKSKKNLNQYLGRVFRSENPIVFDLVDNVSITLRHLRSRLKWYKSHSGTGYKIEVSEGFPLCDYTLNTEAIKTGKTANV